MKQYRIERKAECGVVAKVVAELQEYPLPHIVCHSPTGFETGYGGSGPSDLALAILADHFGEGERQIWEGVGRHASRAAQLYGLFKWDFIAPRQLQVGETYTIRSDEIEAWLTARDGEIHKEAIP